MVRKLISLSTLIWLVASSPALAGDPEPNRENWSRYYFAGEKAYEQGNFSEAEQLFQSALKEAEQLKISGPAAQTILHLAKTYHAEKKDSEAEPLYKRAIEIYANSDRPNRFHAVAAIQGYAQFLRDTNRSKEAADVEAGSMGLRIKQTP